MFPCCQSQFCPSLLGSRFRIRRTAWCASGYMHCLILRSFKLNLTPFYMKADLRYQCAVRTRNLLIILRPIVLTPAKYSYANVVLSNRHEQDVCERMTKEQTASVPSTMKIIVVCSTGWKHLHCWANAQKFCCSAKTAPSVQLSTLLIRTIVSTLKALSRVNTTVIEL